MINLLKKKLNMDELFNEAVNELHKGCDYHTKGKYIESLKHYEKRRKIFEKILPPHHESLVTIYCNMGLSFNDIGKSKVALSYYEKSLKIAEIINDPDIARIYNNIGLCGSKS